MKKLVYSLGVLILAIQLTACDNNSTKESEGTEIEIADEESQKENAEAIREMERNEKELKANSTTLSFDKEVHDFGQIKLESENYCTFKVTNTGDKPLIIEDVQASCGCTTPEKPEGPIAPGKSDVIKVKFKPNSKSENGKPVEKTITVTANTEEQISVVKIKGIVL